ncbi:MAG: monofunctional biosynthetic peptidoglycan transglycosylase [Bacteroidota bacterium]|jgi:monofunctional biosynthetic peptidoglycan transglycosylase
MRTLLRIIFRIFLRVVIIFAFLSMGGVILYRFVPVPLTPLMIIRLVEQNGTDKPFKLKKDWLSYDEIPNDMKLAVIASEDQQFFQHHGFDFDAIEKAYEQNKKGKKIKGASTISQQTAKNVFLWPGRSYLRKGLEAYFTVLIELFWSKQRILHVYLNVIEMGDGIYGTSAAAENYFRKPASGLTRTECALIAAVLPNPRRWSPANPSGYIQWKKQRIITRIQKMPTEVKNRIKKE